MLFQQPMQHVDRLPHVPDSKGERLHQRFCCQAAISRVLPRDNLAAAHHARDMLIDGCHIASSHLQLNQLITFIM